MLTLRRRAPRLDDASGASRKARATFASVVVHIALFVGLWHVLQFPRAFGLLLEDRPSSAESAPERVRYFTVAPPAGASPAPRAAPPGATARERPASAPQSRTPSAPPIVAPTEVPTALPPVPRGTEGPVRGPLASGRGAVKGVQPGYTEPRIWVESDPVVAPALTGDAKLDSAISARVVAYRDSMALHTVQPNKFERGDWTVEKDGKKYGIDRQFIRLGKFSIPTALLGFLPMNQQANPIAYEREKRLEMMRSEIIAQAAQAMNEEEFRRAVKAIRDRKEKERRALEKKKKDDAAKVISDY